MARWNSGSHKWEQAGDPFAFVRKYPPKPESTPEEIEELKRMSTNAAKRRIVLLPEDVADIFDDMERVLAETSAHLVQENLRKQSDRFPGRLVAAEWLTPTGWKRWLWRRG